MKLASLFAGAMIAICIVTSPAKAQTYTESVVYSFCTQSGCTDGSYPASNLIQDSGGNFYATTAGGGADGNGTVFELSDGALSVLYSFCSEGNGACTDGNNPHAGLLEVGGNFYGTTDTYGGGAYASSSAGGTVFQLIPPNQLNTLHSFCGDPNCTDGDGVPAGLVQGSDGYFYGITSAGGTGAASQGGAGTVFKINTAGAFSTIYDFCTKTNCADGEGPVGALVAGSGGYLYGTTEEGGANGYGTFFKISTTGSLTTLYSFCSQSKCADGFAPQGGLVLGTDGNFYGTTTSGGANDPDETVNVGGTVFKITPLGSLTTLYSFCALSSCADGSFPNATLIQASDGNFYGTAGLGGYVSSSNPQGPGSVFKITPSGQFTTIYAFCGSLGECTDGAYPNAGLLQASGGSFYGTTYFGGNNNQGTVFTITVSGGKPNVSFAFSVSPSPLSAGQSPMLSVAVSGGNNIPTGTITFSAGSLTICKSAIFDGVATCTLATTGTLAPGTYAISVNYSGDSNYNSASATENVTLNPAAVSVTLAASSNSFTPPASETLIATVQRSAAGATGNPTGTVSFYGDSTLLGTATLSNGQAKLTEAVPGNLPGGNYAITAKYNGDADDLTGASTLMDVTVLSATETSVAASPNPVPANSPFTLAAQVKERYGSAVPTGTVAFTVGSYSLGSVTLNDGQAVVNTSDLGIAKGTYAVTAAYSGDADNASSSATVNVTVQ